MKDFTNELDLFSAEKPCPPSVINWEVVADELRGFVSALQHGDFRVTVIDPSGEIVAAVDGHDLPPPIVRGDGCILWPEIVFAATKTFTAKSYGIETSFRHFTAPIDPYGRTWLVTLGNQLHLVDVHLHFGGG